jgi:hypothetical protein
MAAGGVTLVVILVVVTGYGVLARPSASLDPAPAEVIDDFPAYTDGGRLADMRIAHPLSAEIMLTATHTGLGISLVQRCDVAGNDHVVIRWWLEDRFSEPLNCGGVLSVTSTLLDNDGLARLGVRPGRQLHARVRVDATDGDGRPVDLSHGGFAAALYERMSFDDYVFPPRPPTLAPLPDELDGPSVTSVASDPADPNAPRTAVVGWGGLFTVRMTSQTPGQISVVLNGKTLCTAVFWDYDRVGFGCPQREGGPGTIRFEPREMTGAWRATISPH